MTSREAGRREPLTPLSFHILLALADAPRHGYGILKEVEARTGGATSPSTGALYLALQRMQEGGLIEETAERPPEEDDDPRRKYYRLTAEGQSAAAAESRRLLELVGVAVEKALLPRGALGLGTGTTGGGSHG